MRNPLADLHIHSTYSDGLLTPSEIVKHAIQLNLTTIAITDHDSVSGIKEAIKLSQDRIEIIPAMEMSSNIGDLDIHILGYYIDYEKNELNAYLEIFKEYRLKRIEKIIKHLFADGIKLNFERIKSIVGNGSLGRPHIAEALLRDGYVHSINEAFVRYLGYHTPYYEPKKAVLPKEVIQKIKDCQGIPVIAHPGTIGNRDVIYHLIIEGIAGIEVWHPEHSKRQQQELREIALKNGLLMTGGSDFHGFRGSENQIGKYGCAEEEVQMLKEYNRTVYRKG